MDNQQSVSAEDRKKLRAARIGQMQEELPNLRIEEEHTRLQLQIDRNLLERASVMGKYMQHQKDQKKAAEESTKKEGTDGPTDQAAG